MPAIIMLETAGLKLSRKRRNLRQTLHSGFDDGLDGLITKRPPGTLHSIRRRLPSGRLGPFLLDVVIDDETQYRSEKAPYRHQGGNVDRVRGQERRQRQRAKYPDDSSAREEPAETGRDRIEGHDRDDLKVRRLVDDVLPEDPRNHGELDDEVQEIQAASRSGDLADGQGLLARRVQTSATGHAKTANRQESVSGWTAMIHCRRTGAFAPGDESATPGSLPV